MQFTFFPLLAQAENSDAGDDIPMDVEEVKETLLDTLGSVWKGFLEHIPYLVAGLVCLFGTWIVVKLVVKVVDKVLKKKQSMRSSLRELILRFVSIGLWFIGLLLVAMIVFPGLTPAKALGGLGLLSVAVGLAFKDIFENFFAGVLLLWRFPFEKGDFIECEGITGKVEDVQIRMSKIRQTTGELVVVPNIFLFKNPVEVLTNPPLRRMHITAGIGYGEDVAESVAVIEKAVRSCKSVNADRELQVFPMAFGASSIDIDVAWWTEPKPGQMRKSRGEVITAIKKALDDAGIEIPFPYRTLTFSEPLKLDSDSNCNDDGAYDRDA